MRKRIQSTKRRQVEFLRIKNTGGEELRWRRSRTGRTLSPAQIHQKNI